jgi:hypothetical protein
MNVRLFMIKFEACHTDVNGCRVWRWRRGKNGYHQFGKKERQYVHRMAYKLFNGEIPEGLCVCHRCDNKSCVNPEHLFLGTIRENNEDKHAKGRSRGPQGEAHPRAKLTDDKVREIVRRYGRGDITQVQLGEEYGVAGAIISQIVNGKLWKHLNLKRS